MANPRRSVRSLSLSRRRSVLLVLSVFVLYKAMYQVQITFYNSKIMEHEDIGNQNAALVFNLHSKYPRVPSNERPCRWLRTLLERDLKRLGSKAVTISANRYRAALAVKKPSVLFHSKYPTVPSSERPRWLRTLLERDLKRLGSKAATISANRVALAVKKPSVLFSADGNVYPDGLYYVEVHIGRPAKVYYLDMDTGSELTWLHCDAPCRSCGNGPNGLYDLKNARVVECRNAVCAKVQQGQSYVCEENLNGQWTQCDYEVEYADGSSTMGALIADSITLFLSNGSQRHTGAIIGCGYDQRGDLAKDPALTDGVMGLSNSKASLPSQLAQKGIVKNVIGQCLGSNGGDHLFFGDALVPSSGMMWVPMTGSLNKFGYYQARMWRIWYGADELDMKGAIDDMTFDSGASFTYFVPIVYNAVLSAVLAQAKKWDLVRDQLDSTLPFCWSGNLKLESASDEHQYFKSIYLDFGGKSILELRPEGYLITSRIGNVCLGILNAKESGLEITDINIIGDISMRGYLIVYNNVRGQIGWVHKDCNNQSP